MEETPKNPAQNKTVFRSCIALLCISVVLGILIGAFRLINSCEIPEGLYVNVHNIIVQYPDLKPMVDRFMEDKVITFGEWDELKDAIEKERHLNMITGTMNEKDKK